MPKGKKKFIDKKNAVTFHLVHRSQHDPLVADEKAPQHVLVATNEKKPKGKVNKEEENKFGVFFDDDYDYLQHLRDASTLAVHWEPVETGNNNPTNAVKVFKKVEQGQPDEEEEAEVYRVERPKQLNLPSSVFASEFEEDVGLLNKAAPQSGLRLDLDPEVVAAMDDDFDFEDPDNELEDNFMELANVERSSDEDDIDSGDESDVSDCYSEDVGDDLSNMACSEEQDEVGSLNGRLHMFEEEETKSRFTDYSMTSSVMRRNEQLSLLDHRFEKMFAGYDDNEIGPLDCEEIEGYVAPNSNLLLQCAEEFEKQRAVEKPRNGTEKPNLDVLSDTDSEGEMRDFVVKGSDDEDKWDCQSVLSTYSNIYNRPKLISERNSGPGKIRICKKTGLPLGVFDSGNEKLTAKSLAKFNAEQGVESNSRQNVGDAGRAESVISTLSTLSIRPKGETPEERRERKRALKEYRRERILERKANTEAFKEEKKRQEKIMLNNKKNMPTLHIL